MQTATGPARRFPDAIPLFTSLLAHAAIVLIGILVLRSLVTPCVTATEDQVLVPETDFSGSTPFAPSALTDFPRRDAGERLGDDSPATPHHVTSGLDAGSKERPELSPMDAGQVTTPQMFAHSAFPAIGDAAGGSARGNNSGIGSAPFGRPSGNGTGLGKGTIFGAGGGGKGLVESVVFVCDASGSMLDKFAALRDQLQRSVGTIKPVTSFNIIFFRDEHAVALSSASLLPGSRGNRQKAKQFLEDMTPSGPTDPIPALEIAFRQRPQLIWLLTDGDFPDNKAVLEFIRRRNADQRVKINTIAFVDRGDAYEQVLKSIASENSGSFRYVSGEDLP